MDTNKISPSVKKWGRVIAIAIIALIGFSYLNRHGISPIWTAILIVLFPGIFRFIYRVICLLVAVAVIICILGFLIF